LYINTVQTKVLNITKIPDKLPQNLYSNTQKVVLVIIRKIRAVFVRRQNSWAVRVKSRIIYSENVLEHEEHVKKVL